MDASKKPDNVGSPSPTDTISWPRLTALFEQAVGLPHSERDALLAKAQAESPALRDELESLLRISDATAPSNKTSDAILASLSAFSHASNLSSGQHIGHYEIVEKLGGGGMGMVYKARDLNLQRLAALKFLPVHLGNDPRTRARFLQEARAASAIDHPNICTVYEIGELDDGPIYIAMAYYDGLTVKRLIEQGPIHHQQAVDIAIQAASGLLQAHAHGIVHRDVKPANIISTSSGLVKILDFGVAKSAELNLTQTGATVGTIAYMSPEQARGENVDHRADIWSVGVVLYEMLTGKRPFRGDHSHAIMYNILHRTPEPVTGLRAGIPLQLSHIVHKLLAKPIEERYQSLDALVRDLRALQHRDIARKTADQSVQAVESMLDTPEPAPAADLDQLKILVVDDEPELELLIRHMFRKHTRDNGWILEFASNGQEALEKLAAHPDTALVLTDLNMPVMDGLALLDRLQDVGRPLKTVVVSAYSDMSNIRAAMNRGAFDFVIKPFDMADLEKTIEKSYQAWTAARRASQNERELISLQKELAVARQIQQAIQPSAFPTRPDVALYGYATPAHEISGTFYDYFEIDDERIGFFLGDVGGKGISTTLFMTMVQTHLKSLGQRGTDPGACVSSVNRLLVPEGFPDISARVFLGMLNTQTRELEYCNAGAKNPFHVRAAPHVAPMPGSADPPIWHVRDHAFTTHRLQLHPGDGLFLFTRGLVGAANESGNAFSSERLAGLLRDRGDGAPADIIRYAMRALMDHMGDAMLDEDATVLAVRLTPPVLTAPG